MSDCQHTSTRAVLCDSGPHYAKRICNGCEKFMGWVARPDGDNDRREAKHRKLVKKYGSGFCELCMRTESELPPPQVLEGHHVKEYADGGGDERENVWILCTFCHKTVHHIRVYLGHYHPNGAKPVD